LFSTSLLVFTCTFIIGSFLSSASMLRTAVLAGKWGAVHWLVGHGWRRARLCFGQGASMLDIIEHGEVREIRLARPPVNALNGELLRAFTEAVVAGRDASALVVTGQPGVFSAGLDVPAILGMDRAAMTQVFLALWHAQQVIAMSPVPVVFGITGHCPAGGTVLAIHADFRVLAHTLSGGGWLGTEYPIMLRVHYRDATGGKLTYSRGFFLHNQDNYPTQNATRLSSIDWQRVEFDLLAASPRPWKIETVQVVAQGWDYHSAVREVHLWAE
jgi:hypothetical protein